MASETQTKPRGRTPYLTARGGKRLGRRPGPLRRLPFALGATCIVVFSLTVFGTPASASATPKPVLLAAHSEGGEYFELIVRDAPRTRLVLYLNGRRAGSAKVNNRARATFHEVVLIGTGKLSFSMTVTGRKGRQYQRPTGYVRFYRGTNESVEFLRSLPPVPPASPTPPQEP